MTFKAQQISYLLGEGGGVCISNGICVVPENIHTPTTAGIGNSSRVGEGGG